MEGKMVDPARMAALVAESRGVLASAVADEFAADPGRFTAMHVMLGDLLFDYSKQRITKSVLAELIAVAEAAKVEDRRDQMFRGELINVTERRAVLHTAL